MPGLILLMLSGAVAGAGVDCKWMMRYDDTACADMCVPSYVGPCPRAVPVLFGRLVPGRCLDRGFVVPAGQRTVNAISFAAVGVRVKLLWSVKGCRYRQHLVDSRRGRKGRLSNTIGSAPRRIGE